MARLLDFRRPHVLRSEDEFEAAQERVDELLRMNPPADSPEGEELRFLSVLMEEYEQQEAPIEGASPQEVVDFMLEQHGMTRGDLAELMGGRSRVSDFFNGKRPLSLRQVRLLASRLHVPADVLIGVRGPGVAEA